MTAACTCVPVSASFAAIVFETEVRAAPFLMPRERIEWWPDDRLAEWSEMDSQTGPSCAAELLMLG